MISLDSLQEILYVIRQNKLRTALTAFGVFWGIFMLILLLGAGEGLKNGVKKSFSSDVQNSLWVWASTTSIPYLGGGIGRQIQFTEADLDAIKYEIEGVEAVAGEIGGRRAKLLAHKERTGSYDVMGVTEDYFKIKVYQDYHFGRRLNFFDEKDTRKVIVLGTKVVDRLFYPGADPVGEYVTVQGVSFRIVGVFYDSGWQGRMSERAYIPINTYQKTFGAADKVQVISLIPESGVSGFVLEDQVMTLLKSRHRVSPADRKAIFINNLAEEAKRTEDLFSAITFFIWFVGIGTLMAGIVGISNIMLITVKERTPEIGVRKALGATPIAIISSILFESVLVTALAGYAGLVLGVALLELVSFALNSVGADLPFFHNPSVNFEIAIASLLILVSIGTVAGFIPAWQAARISPIEAMRAG